MENTDYIVETRIKIEGVEANVEYNYRDYYKPGDTSSICNCITNIGNKTAGIKEYYKETHGDQPTISSRLVFIRPDHTIIDEVDVNYDEILTSSRLLNLFLFV